MINKHLWKKRGPWRAKEGRVCLKCGARVKLVAVPRSGSHVFLIVTKDGRVKHGAMSRCEP